MASIFDHLCDAAILEEARSRLGTGRAMELAGVKEEQFYVYRNRLAKDEKLPPERRRALVAALNDTLPPDQDPIRLLQRTVEDLGKKLDALAPPERPRRVRR